MADIMLEGYVDAKLVAKSRARTAAPGVMDEIDAVRAANRNQVIMRKAGLAEEWVGNETSAVGSDFEPGFVNLARRKWGWTLAPYGALVYDAQCARLACTPDFYVDSPWGRGLCQTKITTAQAEEDCKTLRDGSPSTATYAQGVPTRYLLQKQAELACTGLAWNALLVLHCSGGEFKGRLYPVQRHEGVIARLRLEAMSAWQDVERLRRGEIA